MITVLATTSPQTGDLLTDIYRGSWRPLPKIGSGVAIRLMDARWTLTGHGNVVAINQQTHSYSVKVGEVLS